MSHYPFALVILDGFGYRQATPDNAVTVAHTPTLDFFIKHFPHCILEASGKAVGLPDEFIGGSEVGHITIGAGRIIEQPITTILRAINDGSLFTHKILIKKLQQLKKSGGRLHLVGLLSDAGIHGHHDLLHALIALADQIGITTFIHPILDGRDVPPKSAASYLQHLDALLKDTQHCKIGSLHGRFFAMDRGKNWQRIKKSIDVLTQKHSPTSSWQQALEKSYAQGITDEFFEPVQLDSHSIIKDGDGIIMTNVRSDRSWQLAAALLSNQAFNGLTITPKLSFLITPTPYHHQLKTTVLWPTVPIKNTLKDVLSQNKKRIFSIAETEKYAHVTYFFAGEKEDTVLQETQILIPSHKCQTYANDPEMSAQEITDHVIKSLRDHSYDFYLINYANADMVGHSGDFNATVKAIEFLDYELKRLYHELVEKMDGTLIITADHGNAEQMKLADGTPCTAHTTNPVPFFFINRPSKDSSRKLPLTQLADIAPFILRHMNLPIPHEMNGKN